MQTYRQTCRNADRPNDSLKARWGHVADNRKKAGVAVEIAPRPMLEEIKTSPQYQFTPEYIIIVSFTINPF